MTVSTVDESNKPSSRVVLLKEIKDNPLKTKGNIGSIEHLIKKRLNNPYLVDQHLLDNKNA